MSTETANSTLPRDPSVADDQLQDQVIQGRIDRARFQVKLVEIATAATQLAVVVLVYLLVVTFIDHWIVGLNLGMRLAALVLLLVVCALFAIRRLVPCLTRPVNPVYAARAIEQAVPTLKNSLINFLLLRSQRQFVRPVIFAGVQRQAAEDLESVDVDAAVDRSDLIHVGYLLAALVVLVGIYKITSPKDPFQSVARVLAPWKPIPRPSRVQITQVLPGSVDVYRGEQLEVTALVDGLDQDESVVLRYSTTDGQAIDREILLQQQDGDPRYRAVLATGDFGIQEPLTYHLSAGDSRTEDYRVLLKDAPSITLQSIVYRYPRYTQWADEKVTGQGDLKALEGTQVRLEALANQPIRSAYLELFLPEDLAVDSKDPKPSKAVAMKFDQQRAWGQLLLALLPDRRTPQYVAYQIRFLNEEGQRNLEPARFQIEVTPDLSPLVDVVAPQRRDVELAENDRLMIEIRALDPDFALRRLSLQASVGSAPLIRELLLDQLHQGPALARYEFVPRNLRLSAGDVVLYRAIAEDNRTAIGSESPDPNRQQSEQYRIRIVAADPAADSERSEPSEAGTPQDADGGGDATAAEESGGAGQQASPSETGDSTAQQQPSAEEPSGADAQPGSPEDTAAEGSEPTSPEAGGPADSTSQPDQTPSESPSEGNPAGEAAGSEANPSSPVPSDGSNDADAFERILEHLRQQGESAEGSSEESPQANGARGGPLDQENPSGGEPAEAQPGDGGPSSDASGQATGEPRTEESPRQAGSEAGQTESAAAPDSDPSRDTGESAAGDTARDESRTDEEGPGGAGPQQGPPTGEAPKPDRSSSPDGASSRPSDSPTGEESGSADEESTRRPAQDSATKPSEKAGEESGPSAATQADDSTRPEPSGNRPDGSDESAQPSGQQPTEGGEPGSQSSPPTGPTTEGPLAESPTLPGGQPATGETAESTSPTDEQSTADDPNLQFAEEATDLALEHLRDQQQNAELLERLGWTPEQAAAFLKRWEELQREANQQGRQGEQARRRLEDQIRGLGLRPREAAVRRDVSNADTTRGLSEGGGRTSPPPEYRDQYRAFLRSFSRPDQDQDK
jgi:hypothetical protein